MVTLLRADAALPRAKRRFLQDFNEPRIETHVGVWKPGSGLRFADVMVIEKQPPRGQAPRVETFSFKSRDLRLLDRDALTAQMKADANAAMMCYGETLDIRRAKLMRELELKTVQVQRVRLIYEGGKLKPGSTDNLKRAVHDTQAGVMGVEVLVQ